VFHNILFDFKPQRSGQIFYANFSFVNKTEDKKVHKDDKSDGMILWMGKKVETSRYGLKYSDRCFDDDDDELNVKLKPFENFDELEDYRRTRDQMNQFQQGNFNSRETVLGLLHIQNQLMELLYKKKMNNIPAETRTRSDNWMKKLTNLSSFGVDFDFILGLIQYRLYYKRKEIQIFRHRYMIIRQIVEKFMENENNYPEEDHKIGFRSEFVELLLYSLACKDLSIFTALYKQKKEFCSMFFREKKSFLETQHFGEEAFQEIYLEEQLITVFQEKFDRSTTPSSMGEFENDWQMFVLKS
jgi:hypothetical protein